MLMSVVYRDKSRPKGAIRSLLYRVAPSRLKMLLTTLIKTLNVFNYVNNDVNNAKVAVREFQARLLLWRDSKPLCVCPD